MKHYKINKDWNAQPNVPLPKVKVFGNAVQLEFVLNHYLYKKFKQGQKGLLKFKDCYMYRLGAVNDHGFYLGQFRYGPDEMPWGEFYELTESDWKENFPQDRVVVDETLEDRKDLKHYLFFFRDETFECIAREFKFEYS